MTLRCAPEKPISACGSACSQSLIPNNPLHDISPLTTPQISTRMLMTRSYAVQNLTRRPARPPGESSTSASAASRTTMPQPMPRPTASAENPAPTAPMGLAATPPAVAPVVGIEAEPNSDSEYETDPDAEPEEFYLSLDLTIPTPIHAGPSSNPHANVPAVTTIPPPLPLSSTTRSGRSGRRHLASRPAHSLPHHPSASTHSHHQHHHHHHPSPDEDLSNQVARWAGGDGGRLQLLDLHTENPLVSFNNRIWSGSWMGTVGTEMYILCPEGPAPEDSVEVRGVYISQKDTSAAAAATTGAPVGASGSLPDAPGVAGADPDVGRVIAVSATRIHCLPAVVTAKERRFGIEDETRTYGWRPGKSTFLERLETIQIAKGERKPRGEEEEEESSEEESVEAEGTAFQQRMDGAGSIEGDMDSEDDENEDLDTGQGVYGNDQEAVQEAATKRAAEGSDKSLGKEGYFARGWDAGKRKPKDTRTDNAGEGPSSLPTR